MEAPFSDFTSSMPPTDLLYCLCLKPNQTDTQQKPSRIWRIIRVIPIFHHASHYWSAADHVHDGRCDKDLCVEFRGKPRADGNRFGDLGQHLWCCEEEIRRPNALEVVAR